MQRELGNCVGYGKRRGRDTTAKRRFTGTKPNTKAETKRNIMRKRWAPKRIKHEVESDRERERREEKSRRNGALIFSSFLGLKLEYKELTLKINIDNFNDYI